MDTSTDVNNNMSFIKSNKGQRLLAINGNVYRCNKKTPRKKYWKCVVRGCTMSVHTDENDVYLCGGKSDHDHEPNSDLIQAKRLRQQMKQRVLNELTPIAMIYEEETAKSSVDRTVLATFPTNQEICKFCKACNTLDFSSFRFNICVHSTKTCSSFT